MITRHNAKRLMNDINMCVTWDNEIPEEKFMSILEKYVEVKDGRK